MALFTTIPASEMIPIPVMMITKSILNVHNPPNTPIVLNIILEKIMSERIIELNCVTRINMINAKAISMALPKNADDSSCSCCSPVNS